MTRSLFFFFLFSALISVCATQTAGRPWVNKQLVRDAESRHALCADGTPGAYYIENVENSSKLVIFLRGGGFCFDSETCSDRDEWTTTSNDDMLPNRTRFHAFLSSFEAENPLYYNATRLFLHYCSNDLWMGNNTYQGFEFRGHAILQAVLEDTVLDNQLNLDEVLVAGVSAGGIGATYHIQSLQTQFPNARILLLTDSNVFTPALDILHSLYPKSNLTTPFSMLLEAYRPTYPSCQTQVRSAGQSDPFNCCVFTDCMLRQGFIPEDIGVMLIQPMLDLFLFAAGLERYDNQQPGAVPESAEPPLARIFELGSRLMSHMNFSDASNLVQETAAAPTQMQKISYYQPACTLHSLLRPIDFTTHDIHPDTVVQAGSFSVRFSDFNTQPNWFGTLSVNGVTMREAFELWVGRVRLGLLDHPVVEYDTCRGWSCNPTCPEHFEVNIGQSTVPGIDVPLITGFLIVSLLTSLLVITITWHKLRMKDQKKRKIDLAIEIRMLEASSVKGKDTMIQVRNLTYEIPVQNNSLRLLDSVSVDIEPGKVTAIMGPSGAGKTTFLDVLSGRRTVGTAYGSIHFGDVCMLGSGESQKWLLERSGYVKQNITPACPTLTVRENLLFAADLRLSADLSVNKKRERVDAVIRMLRMDAFENVVVGTGQGLGLSGGQRKKLGVAIQLLKNPGILFLDEPTSGLDSTSSLEISMLLRRLARSNRTIVLTIHQPRVEIWEMLDSVLLLCGGKVTYHGPSNTSHQFFLDALKDEHSDVVQQVVDRIKDGMNVDDNPAHLLIDVLRFPEVKYALLAHPLNDPMPALLTEPKHPTVSPKSIKSEFLGLLALVMRNLFWGNSLLKICIQIFIYTLAVAWICRAVSEPLVVASSYFLVSLPHFFAISGSYFVLIRTRFPLFWEEVADGVVTPLQFFTALAAELAATTSFASVAATPLAYFLLTPEEWHSAEGMLRMTVGWGLTSFSLSMMCLSVYILTQSQPVLTSFIALASAFSGVVVPAHSLPVELRWFVEINPLYLGNVAVLNIGMRGQSDGECEYDSDTFCVINNPSFALDQLGMLDKDATSMVWRILIIAFVVVLFGFVGFYVTAKEQLRRLALLDPTLSTRIDDADLSARSLDGDQEDSLRDAVLSRRHTQNQVPSALPTVILTSGEDSDYQLRDQLQMQMSPAAFLAKLGSFKRNKPISPLSPKRTVSFLPPLSNSTPNQPHRGKHLSPTTPKRAESTSSTPRPPPAPTQVSDDKIRTPSALPKVILTSGDLSDDHHQQTMSPPMTFLATKLGSFKLNKPTPLSPRKKRNVSFLPSMTGSSQNQRDSIKRANSSSPKTQDRGQPSAVPTSPATSVAETTGFIPRRKRSGNKAAATLLDSPSYSDLPVAPRSTKVRRNSISRMQEVMLD